MVIRKRDRAQLLVKVDDWTKLLRVNPRYVRIQQMTTKWGSCSSSGIVTLAADLAREDPGFQDFVIVHELLHLRVRNHGRVFKALMSMHVRDWRAHDVRR